MVTVADLTAHKTASEDWLIKRDGIALERLSCQCEKHPTGDDGYIWKTRIIRHNGQKVLLTGKEKTAIKQFMSYLVAGEI